MYDRKILGFTLAEALITLLIVSLITIASIPVLTKKNRTKSYPRGSWVCTLNEEGQHVVYSSLTKTWSVTGSKCKFIPPNGARNFEVVAVGGGGGGASGANDADIIRLKNGSTDTFVAPADGEYEITLVGGGGQGGKRQNNANRCKENPGGPGGSGGFVNKIITLTQGTSYTLRAGRGGSGGGYNGGGGSESSIASGGTTLVNATGGGGGGGRWGAACGKGPEDRQDDNWGRRGSAGSPNGKEGTIEKDPRDNDHVRTTGGAHCKTYNREDEKDLKNYKLGGINCNTLLTDPKYLNGEPSHNLRSGNGYMKFEDVYSFPYGYGGAGHDQTGDRESTGGPGLLILRYNVIYSGEGGKASTALRPPVYPSMKYLEATIGAGGSGATYENSTGYKGGRTSFVIETDSGLSTKYADGADGGRIKMSTKSSATSAGFIAGGNGGISALKLLSVNLPGALGGFVSGNSSVDGMRPEFKNVNHYGAGGGGGGANDTSWGKGANGAPGAVMIYW